MRRLLDITTILWLLLHSAAWGQATRAWTDQRVAGPFVFHADFRLDRRQALLRDMTRLQRQVATALSLEKTQEPIDVYLFAASSTYHGYMQWYFPGVPNRRAMFVKSQSPGNVFAHESENLGTDLRHECTHALLHAALPFVPLWLDEGLAEYFEVPAGERAFDNPHLRAIRNHLRWRRSVPPLSRLEGLRDLRDMGQHEYRDAWAWVHFMLHGPPPAREELVAFLTDLRNQVPPTPLSQRLERRLPGVEHQFVEHFKRWKR